MTEDNQNMEEILSSIKNILEEDEKQQNDNGLTVKEDVVDEILNSEIGDDIFELSQDMRISDADMSTDDINAETAKNINQQETASVADDITDWRRSEPTFEEPTPADEPVFTEAPTFEEPAPADEPVFTAAPTFEEPAPADEPVFTAAPTFEEPTPADEPVFTEASTFEEPAPADEPVFTAAPTFEEPTPADEPVFTAAPTFEEQAPADEPIFTAAPTFEEPAPADEPVFAEANSQEPTDVSTGMMSNFAKLFSHDEEIEASDYSKTTDSQITMTGDTSKTLEQFVLDAVVKVVGSEIKKKLNETDFQSVVKAEIEKQTKEWLENNIQTIVDEKIKQEIERVVAKVNS